MAARKAALFYPVIGVALLAKYPWVRIVCDSCETVNELDLRVVFKQRAKNLANVEGDAGVDLFAA